MRVKENLALIFKRNTVTQVEHFSKHDFRIANWVYISETNYGRFVLNMVDFISNLL